MASGGLTFTFYGAGNAGNPPVVEVYDTTMDTVAGTGLEDDGTLMREALIRFWQARFLRPPGGAQHFEAMSILRRITPTVAEWVG